MVWILPLAYLGATPVARNGRARVRGRWYFSNTGNSQEFAIVRIVNSFAISGMYIVFPNRLYSASTSTPNRNGNPASIFGPIR